MKWSRQLNRYQVESVMATVASGSGGGTRPSNPPFRSSRTQLYTTPASLHSYHNCKPFSLFSFSFSSTLSPSKHFQQNPLPDNPNTVADKVLEDILNSGIIACLRAQSAEVAIEADRAAITGGISVLEFVMTTPGVFEVLRYLVREYPSTSIDV